MHLGRYLPDRLPPSVRIRLLEWLLPLVVLSGAYSMQRSVALIGLDLHHDTLMFDAARRMLNGELPFRDFFYQYNLGTVVLHALALKAFGTTIASLKIVTAMAYSMIAVLIYACGVIQGPRWWAFGAAVLWSSLSIFHMPSMNGYHAWSTVYMMTSVMGGALFLLLGLRNRPFVWSFLAGICFNLAFWFKQVAGLQILAVLVWIIYNALRPMEEADKARKFRTIFVGYALGGLASAAPLFIYLYQHSIYYDWWQSAFVFNRYFAGSGSSGSRLDLFVQTFFPVTTDLGYRSVIWALLPVCFMAVITVRDPGTNKYLHQRTDVRGVGILLFAFLSMVGWIQYFPLSHAFHTQLFSAPLFVLLGVVFSGLVGNGLFSGKHRLAVGLLLVLSLSVAIYESIRHLSGLRAKVSQPLAVITADSPAQGLRLAPDIATNFGNFYERLVRAKEVQGSRPSIPMSVDPLRALIPSGLHEPSTFKMGLDWTWPNELVEPGFNSRLAEAKSDRKSLIYADSLVHIQGYIPAAILQMPSPITATHTLYLPSSDPIVLEPEPIFVRNSAIASGEAISPIDRMYWQTKDILYHVLFIDQLSGISFDDVAEIHVSGMEASEFPQSLSKLEYDGYLKKHLTAVNSDLADCFNLRDGRYVLNQSLDETRKIALAKFMLSTGKLFSNQNRPRFRSTLQFENTLMPFIGALDRDSEYLRVLVPTNWGFGSKVEKFLQHRLYNYFLAIPAWLLMPYGESFLYLQIVYKDGTTRNLFIHHGQNGS